jgi:hypothetical protein
MCSYDHGASAVAVPAPEAPSSPASLEQLEREICELAAHIAVATCRWLGLVAEFDDRRGWAAWGLTSCAHWLSWRCSIGLGTARQHVRVAHRLRELPVVREAFSCGELSYCKVRALARVALPATEAGLVEIARHATGAQLEKLVRCYAGALAATLGTAQSVQDQRYLKWSWNDDGSLRVEARLPAAEGGLLVKALEAFDREPQEEDDHVASPAAARRADALVAMVRSAVAESSTVSGGADPCELVVHVDAATLASDEVGERCHLADGPALAPETVRRLGCDAAVVRIVERDGRPLTVGRRTRTIPAALRRALRSRDDGCRFPGCTHERYVHAHHIQHWARGGPTTLDNLVQLCSYHHRLVHEGGFGVERARGGSVRFRRPDGRVIAAVPGGGPAGGAGLAEQHRLRGVVVDARTCRPLSAGERLDSDLAMDAMLPRALAARGYPVATLIGCGRAVSREYPRSLQAPAQLEPAGGGDRAS